jgi:outer membrane usher protein PapC
MITKNGRLLARHKLGIYVFLALFGFTPSTGAVEFNIDLLDSDDKDNIDLSRFSQAGYIMPGTYSLSLKLNDSIISDQEITFKEVSGEETSSVHACLNTEQVKMLGLKPDALKKLKFDDNGLCADFSALDGVVLRGDLSELTLNIAVPQAWLEYQDSSWLPPSRWEDGIPGILLDYSVNTNITKPSNGNQTQSASASGTVGANLSSWRLRADYQSNYNHTTGNVGSSQNNFDWSRIYAYRAVPAIMSKLTIGEDYLTSDLFDSWRFIGASLVSDESQLPPKLRGYAPEVTGIARTNAKVTISQQGRVIYETTVPAGPFRIQELNGALQGQLDVRVEEQDGAVQTFQVMTATIPYLTRPGQVRYKLAVGRPGDYNHHVQGPLFGTGEASWGISSFWSLYGGAILSDEYNSFALGLGRDLYHFGAVSADVTQAIARIPGRERLEGRSYRVSYSKRFDDINSEITFAGYRFSEKNYLSMSEFLDARYNGWTHGNSKSLYTVTASKSFSDARLSTYLSWSHQTYWDKEDTDSYSLSASKYFDFGDWKNLTASITANRRNYNGTKDDAAFISLTIPFGRGNLGYNGSWSNDKYTQSASWYERLANNDSYRLMAGTRSGNGEGLAADVNGYYNHMGNLADMTANLNWSEGSYASGGISLNGGMTATAKGAALHPATGRGGTRMLISTGGVANVPIGENGKTNAFGIAVAADIPSYYRHSTSIDVTRLPDDIEASGSPVVEAALTEGAIGYRKFDVLKGQKIIATIAMRNGSYPPFGASVRNKNNQELGMVSDAGLAWLSGINPNEILSVSWGKDNKCQVEIPAVIPNQQLLLPCHQQASLSNGISVAKVD